MRKTIIRLIVTVVTFIIAPTSMGQNVVVEDTFDGNELGWTENTKPDLGECVIMEGEFKFNSKLSSCFFNTKSNHPSLLTSETVMPLDPNQGFEISADISFDHVRSILGISMDNLNVTSGFLLEYDDDYNFIAVAVNETNCYILFYKEAKLIRYKVAAVKMKTVEKNKVLTNIKVVYRDYKLKVLVDGIEMAELRKVNIESPAIALFTTGQRKVNFDNVIISQ